MSVVETPRMPAASLFSRRQSLGGPIHIGIININYIGCLLIAYCPLPIAHCPLPIACCLLPIVYCLLPTAYCLLLCTVLSIANLPSRGPLMLVIAQGAVSIMDSILILGPIGRSILNYSHSCRGLQR